MTLLTDTPLAEVQAAVDAFAFKAETAELALIYFAGHGVEVQGENFLIPVDAKVASNRDVQAASVSLRDFEAAVAKARRMGVILLDSCRDNPFGGGIVPEERSAGTGADGTRSAGEVGWPRPTPTAAPWCCMPRGTGWRRWTALATGTARSRRR